MANAFPHIAKLVMPDSPTPAVTVHVDDRKAAVTAIFGSAVCGEIRGVSALLGQRVRQGDEMPWWEPNNPPPDGSFVLLRYGKDQLEIVSDFAGSRAMWYASQNGLFLASTSQRVLVSLMGEFRLAPDAEGWFLSSGTLGPAGSWDARLKLLTPRTALTVTRNETKLKIASAPAVARNDYRDESLEEAISGCLRQLDFHTGRWVLALSGGIDSRVLLHGLQHIPELVCVSWTDPDRRGLAETDISVAANLARHYGREHWILDVPSPTNLADAEYALSRFVQFTEGAIDNVTAYADGLHLWDQLASRGIEGILRGEEQFGSYPARRRLRVLHNMRLVSFNEYRSNSVVAELLSRFPHEVPAKFEKQKTESIVGWRSRLRSQFESPIVYAALNSIRSRFMEVSTPLLSQRILAAVGRLPDRMQSNKRYVTILMQSLQPAIPLARTQSILSRSRFLQLKPVRQLLSSTAGDTKTRELIGEPAQRALVRLLEQVPANPTRAQTTINRIRTIAEDLAGTPPVLDFDQLALRLYLSQAAQAQLINDGRTLDGIERPT